MSDYSGQYVMVYGDPTWWIVDDGKRRKIETPEELHALPSRRVSMLTWEQLNEIPMARKKRKGTADAPEGV